MKLALTYVVTEHLKEPSITTRRYTFVDSSVVFEWTYEGFHPDPKYARHKLKNVVTRDARAVVDAVLKEKERLLVNQSVTRPAGNARKSSSIDLELSVDGVDYRLRIDGPNPDAANPCIYTQSVDSVVSILDRLVRA